MIKKRTIATLAAIAVLGLVALWLLRSHQLELIHTIVVNAVIQKAPQDYPAAKIHETFDRALRQAELDQGRQAYLERLLELSRRLEKVQRLSANELDEILADLPASPALGRTGGPGGVAQGPFQAVLPWLREVPALSDRNQTGAVSRLRAYHPGPSCESPSDESEPRSDAGTDPFFDFHFPASSIGNRTDGLAVGTPEEAPKTRPKPRDHDQER